MRHVLLAADFILWVPPMRISGGFVSDLDHRLAGRLPFGERPRSASWINPYRLISQCDHLGTLAPIENPLVEAPELRTVTIIGLYGPDAPKYQNGRRTARRSSELKPIQPINQSEIYRWAVAAGVEILPAENWCAPQASSARPKADN